MAKTRKSPLSYRCTFGAIRKAIEASEPGRNSSHTPGLEFSRPFLRNRLHSGSQKRLRWTQR